MLLAALVAQLWTIVWPIYGAWRVAGRLAAHADGIDRVIATTILYLSLDVCLNELLGTWSLLAPLPMLLAYTALGAAELVCARAVPRVSIPWRASLPASPLGYLAVVAGALALPHLARALVLPPIGWDELSYHLFKPAVWVFDHALTRLEFPHPMGFLAFYPSNAELIWTTLIGVAHNDLWLHLLNIPLVCVLALIFVQLCRIAGTSREGSWAFAPVVMTTPVVLGWAPTGYVEVVLNVSELAGILFALRWLEAEPERARSWAALCGFACGLAVGVKYAALPIIALLAIVLLVALIARGRRRGLTLEVAIASCAALATGAYWYVRNALETGNPFYPVPFLDLHYAVKRGEPWNGHSILENFFELASSGILGRAWFARAPLLIYVSGPGLGWFGCVSLGIALLGIASMLAAMLRRQAWISRGAAAILFASTLAALYTYLRIPYWALKDWVVCQVRFMTPFVCLGVASGLHLIEQRYRVRTLFVLAALGMLSNASQVELDYPQLPGFWSFVLFAGVLLGAGTSLRSGKLQAWLAPIAGVLAVVSVLAIVPWRERNRFELVRDNVVVHMSRHVALVDAARYVADNFSGKKVAVSFDAFEFLSLFTGRAFDIRPVYVLTHSGRKSPSAYMNADPRHAWNRASWLRNLRASGASAVIFANVLHRKPLPPEHLWLEEEGYRGREFGNVLFYDLRPRAPATESVAKAMR